MNTRTVQSFDDILAVTGILHACGKDMAGEYDLHHWDNPWIKTFLIVLLCLTKNNIRIVLDKDAVATYQTKIRDGVLFFEKLAVRPENSGKGIGNFCLAQIEKEARENGCKKVQMDVYTKSQHAIQFYTRHGYTTIDDDETPRKDVIRMEKVFE